MGGVNVSFVQQLPHAFPARLAFRRGRGPKHRRRRPAEAIREAERPGTAAFEEVCSPGTLLCGTGRSSTAKTGIPLSRWKHEEVAGLVALNHHRDAERHHGPAWSAAAAKRCRNPRGRDGRVEIPRRLYRSGNVARRPNSPIYCRPFARRRNSPGWRCRWERIPDGALGRWPSWTRRLRLRSGDPAEWGSNSSARRRCGHRRRGQLRWDSPRDRYPRHRNRR